MSTLHTLTTSARQLARNPLGIIALFIVLIYGFASSIVGLSNLNGAERLPIIWFLVVFPIFVLAVFAWLVSRHHAKLYSPSDYRRDSAFIKASGEQFEVVAAPGAATARREEAVASQDETAFEARRMAKHLAKLTPAILLAARTRKILWVDDREESRVFERQALQSLGFAIVVVETTGDAIAAIEREQFDVVISGMGRQTDARAGFTLLSRVRNYNVTVPYILYFQAPTADQQTEAWNRGALGIVSSPGDLVTLIVNTVASATRRGLTRGST